MDIRISIADGDLADLESLDDWLRSERELAGRVKLTGSTPRDGELGALSESLIVAVGSGGAITVVGAALAGALKAWLSLPRRSDVRAKIDLPDGTTIEIDAKRVRVGDLDLTAIIRQAHDSSPALHSGTALPPSTAAE